MTPLSGPPMTNPRTIREVLADAEQTNPARAARAHGFDPKTVYRWTLRRLEEPDWPTNDDITEWERLDVERRDIRAKKAAEKREYMKRAYIARGPMHINPLGTVRRLRALHALGWTGVDIGNRLGLSPARVAQLSNGISAKVHRNTASMIADLYDELSMTVPRDPEILPPKHIRVHARERRRARSLGWSPPLAWNNIDDPTERPDVKWRPSRYAPAELAAEWDHLRRAGVSIDAAATQLGITVDAIEKAIERTRKAAA